MELSGEQLRYGFLSQYAVLVRRLSTSSILANALAVAIVSATERDQINGQLGENSKTAILLDIVHRQGVANPSVYVKFFELLSNETAGQNLQGILQKIRDNSTSDEIVKKFQCKSKALEEGDRLTLEKNKDVIIKTVSVENVLPDLISCGAVSWESNEKIISGRTKDDQAVSLYQVIYDSGSASVDHFIEVLEKSDMYQQLGEHLRKDRELFAGRSGKRRIKKSYIDHAQLMEDLKEISHRYETFGLHLGVPLATSRKIKEEVSGVDGVVDYALNRVIDTWLLEGEEVNRDSLVRAIESVGGFAVVAKEVRNQDFPIKVKTTGKILKSLKPMRHKYSELGVQLGVPYHQIKEFETQRGNAELCLGEVLGVWLRMDGEDAPDKDTLWEALEEIGNVRLKEKLEVDYKGIDFKKK